MELRFTIQLSILSKHHLENSKDIVSRKRREFMIEKTVHSRNMKTQHMKFEILKERLSLFYCNLVHLNFVLNMFSPGQIWNEKFHPFRMSWMTSLKVWIVARGKIVNQLHKNFFELTGWLIYFSCYKQILLRFHN